MFMDCSTCLDLSVEFQRVEKMGIDRYLVLRAEGLVSVGHIVQRGLYHLEESTWF